MKRITTTTVFVFLLTALCLQAGTFSYLPMKPKVGSAVTMEYTADKADMDMFGHTKNLHVTIFTFTYEAESPVAYEQLLKGSSDKFTAEFIIPEGVVFLMFKVGNGIRYDNNKDEYWSTVVFSESGRPLLGGYMKDAFSYFGMLPVQCKREQDLGQAKTVLLNEIKSHPNNIVAKVNLLMLSVQQGEIEQAELESKLREIVNGKLKSDSPLEAIALSQAYQQLGQKEEASIVMQDAARRFPKGKAEEQAELEKLNTASSLDEFIEMVSAHLKKYPNTYARQNLLDAIVKACTQQGDLVPLAKFLDKTSGIPAMTYYMAANYVGANDSLRPATYGYIKSGLKNAKDPSTKPSFVGLSEWTEEQRIASSLLLFVQGALQRKDGDLKTAEKSLEESIELGGAETDKAAYETYAIIVREQKKNSQAKEICSTAIENGAASQNVVDMYRALLREDGKDSSTVEKKVAELKAIGRNKGSSSLSRTMLNLSLIDGPLSTLNGTTINLSDLKGNVVVLDYWATWCGPCKMSFPSLQKLYERYKDHPKVKFAIVNVWEKGEDRQTIVKDFLSANKSLTFPMYIDDEDKLVAKYGVTGIPTKFYLGLDGKIQFKEVGLLPEEQFIEDAVSKIEFLLGQ